MRNAVQILSTVAVGVMIGCVSFASNTGGTDRDCSPLECAERVRSLDAEMRRLIGDAKCSVASECRTVALGTKPCGGPSQYLAYSVPGLDQSVFQAVVAELNQLYRRQADSPARSGRVSDCSIVTDPGAMCQAGKCVLRRER